jgi:hypothetical protein
MELGTPLDLVSFEVLRPFIRHATVLTCISKFIETVNHDVNAPPLDPLANDC